MRNHVIAGIEIAAAPDEPPLSCICGAPGSVMSRQPNSCGS
jgi:hypothetical protein